MDAVLLANAAATLFLAGLIWLVQVVHYPLFAGVGPDGFTAYHAAHSSRITPVVLPPMAVELGTSWWLAVAPPAALAGEGVLLWAGAVLATATWVATGLLAVPAHGRLGGGFDAAAHRALLRGNWLRTAAWTAHAGVVLALLARVP